MKVHFGQIYIQAGVCFPFSIRFQRRLSEEIRALIAPSPTFTQTYGDDWDLMFRVSAKRTIGDNEIRGPSAFKKDKIVEFTIFLPFEAIQREASGLRGTIEFLLRGVCSVLDSLDIGTSRILARQSSLIDEICSDPAMFDQ